MINTKKKEQYDNKIVLAHTGWSPIQLPTTTSSNNTTTPRIQYAIAGHESQVLTIQFDQPGDHCQSEPGTMMYLSSGISQSVRCDCSTCCQRICVGETCCLLHFTKESSSSYPSNSAPSYCALTPNFPTAKVIPIDMSTVNGVLICQKGAFMASCGGTVQIEMSLDCNCLRCCCGGLGMIRQKLVGTGIVFLNGTGTMVQKMLAPDETILIDTNCLMAFAGSCKMDLRRAGGIMGMMGGGEGIFNTTITGPGLVVVQSMNEITFKKALIANKLYRR